MQSVKKSLKTNFNNKNLCTEFLFCAFFLAKILRIMYNLSGDIMKIKDGYILSRVSDEYVVVPSREKLIKRSVLIKLSNSGAFLWNLLEKDTDEEFLVSSLINEYEIDENTARNDVKTFVVKLQEADLIDI